MTRSKTLAAYLAIMALSLRADDALEKLSDQTERNLSSFIAASLTPVSLKGTQLMHFGGGVERWYIIPGGILPGPIPVRPPTLLPANPLPILDDAYLNCTSIRITRTESEVRLQNYTKSCISDSANGEHLVGEKIETVDELSMKEIFAQIADGIDGLEDVAFLYSLNGDTSLAHFEQIACFTPAFVTEFIGSRRLTVEIDLKNRLALFIANGRWGSYHLDAPEATRLQEFLEKQMYGPNQSTDPTP
jgi:hypothetical protein